MVDQLVDGLMHGCTYASAVSQEQEEDEYWKYQNNGYAPSL